MKRSAFPQGATGGEIVMLVAIMKIASTIYGALVSTILNNQSPDFPYGWLQIWNRWDAPHYIDIARDGYVTTDLHSPNQQYWIAFYPLFPWLIRIVALVVRDFVVSAHLVSFAAAIVAALAFRRLVELDLDRETSRLAVGFLFIFPTAYFLHAGYTESVFLAAVLPCVIAARQRRWAWSALFGALASMTRVNGLLVIPVMMTEALMEYRNERKVRREWLWIPLAATGFVVYLAVNQVVWGDPFHFQDALRELWGKRLTPPWTGLREALARAVHDIPMRAQLRGTLELLFAFLGVVTTAWCAKSLRLSYTLWMLLNLLLITSTNVIMSTPRYLLTFFPMFILFALLARRRPLAGAAVAVTSVMLYAFFAELFIVGIWAF